MNKPSLTNHEADAVAQVLRSGWLGEGPKTAEFEAAIAEFTGAPHVIATNTGTSALHLAMLALGIGPGDEIILPAFTFVSDPMAVTLCGATPVFGDIDPDTLNLSADAVSGLITDRTRAIFPTDYAGLPSDLKPFKELIGDRNIRLIRDASHSFGSLISGRPVGVFSGEDATVFSFDPIKNITCGEGGAALVNSTDVAAKLRALKNLGFTPTDSSNSENNLFRKRREVTTKGFRCHMSDINASIGLAQFDRLPDIIKKKQAAAKRYDQLLEEIEYVSTFQRNYDEIVPFIYPVRITNGQRNKLADHFAERNIHAELRYSPCHREPFFTGPESHLPITQRIAGEVICLPIYADIAPQEIDQVARELKNFLAQTQLN
ncbi:MAG: DegT/DnrJ/EryC1/StrS family aminotransferase [Verrucomicrobiota bacterium]